MAKRKQSKKAAPHGRRAPPAKTKSTVSRHQREKLAKALTNLANGIENNKKLREERHLAELKYNAEKKGGQ